MVENITAEITFKSVDMDTGEMVTTVDIGRDPSEVRVPVEQALGWKTARREREVTD